MIHFFTDPYKDELIYSAIARYHYYTGNIDYKDTLEEIFGKRSVVPSLEIGSNIEVLCKNLNYKYTSDEIIDKHTIYPFYRPFLPQKRQRQLVKEMKYKDASGLYTRLGMISGSICRKVGIYYCPLCAKNEIEAFGESYIHREHQLQGMFLCHEHGVELKKYVQDRKNSSRIEFIRLDNKFLNFNSSGVDESKFYDKLFKISKDAYFLLKYNSSMSREKVLDKYKNLLYEKGLTTTDKKVKQKELYEEFIGFYGKEFLNLMESDIDIDNEYNWLKVITRNSRRTVHPIRHLMLINFLESDIEKFFKGINKEYEPFGKAPWPCLNKVAEHYRKNVIEDLVITEDYKTRVPVGTFSCSCGFVYSRKGPDNKPEDKFKIGRIKSFGKEWEEKLKGYLKEKKYGLREVARLMYCDPKTVIKFDRLLALNSFDSNIKTREKAERNTEDKRLEEYKKNILKVIELNPLKPRTKLRELCKKEYAYLYKNDKEWLFDKLPIKIEAVEHKATVDWNERDEEFQTLIANKYEELMGLEIPIRITISSIGKSLGILTALEKNIDKLPKTERYLKEITEAVEEFQIRRCKKIIDNAIKQQEQIKLWEIQRMAGIRGISFEKIKGTVEKYLIEKSSGGELWIRK